MAYASFEELDVWKKACQQSLAIYRTLENVRDFGLKNQMERAGVSVPSNIAEGAERGSPKDFARFLKIAKGSNAELRTQLYLAKELNLIDQALFRELLENNKQISSMLQGLIRSLST